LGTAFIVEISEKRGRVKDVGWAFQSGSRCFSLGFRPPFGYQLIGEGSTPSLRTVKPSCFSHDLARAHQTKRTVRLHRDKELITLAQIQSLAELSGKNQASPVSKLDAKRLRVDHALSVPQNM